VTTTTAWSSGDTIWIGRSIGWTQESPWSMQTALDLEALEDDFDRAAVRDQQLLRMVRGALRIPGTETTDMNLPTAQERAGGYLAFDANGTPAVYEGPLEPNDVSTSPFWVDVVGEPNLAGSLDAMGVGTAAGNLVFRSRYDPNGPVNALDYGADGNGVADNTAAIQAAIDSAGNYGTVSLPAGTYRFSQLVIPNPIALVGQPCVRSRWNTYGAAVTLLADGSEDPAILIGGTADSVVTEGGYEFAEGIVFRDLLLRPDAGTGRGIVIDGSTSVRATRGPARDIRFENVHVTGFTDHNVEFLGNVFDVRFTGCSSRDCAVTGVIATTAASYNANTPNQIHFYDCYLYGNSTGPQWALDGSFWVHGGGIAYGSGFLMRDNACIYGTKIEGDAAAGGIGLEIDGAACQVIVPSIYNYETGIQIGDGGATQVYNYYLNTIISTATTGILISEGAVRSGVAEVYYYACTTPVTDRRASEDGIPGSLDQRLSSYRTAAPTTGTWVVGAYVRNCAPAVDEPLGWLCTTAGTPGTWSRVGALLPAGTYLATKTIVKTIDLDDDASTDDYQFDDDAANAAEQVITLTNILPAYAELLSWQVRCFETVTGSASMQIDVGTSSGGAELGTGSPDTANDIIGSAAGAAPALVATNAARSLYVSGTPGANWNTLNAGRWSVMLTYIDYGAAYTQKNP
jgi:hypothetical protein